MQFRQALWPSEGDTDAVIHAYPTLCPMTNFSDGTADKSIIERWNHRPDPAKQRLTATVSIMRFPQLSGPILTLDDLRFNNLDPNFIELPLIKGCGPDLQMALAPQGETVTIATPDGPVTGKLVHMPDDPDRPAVSIWRIML